MPLVQVRLADNVRSSTPARRLRTRLQMTTTKKVIGSILILLNLYLMVRILVMPPPAKHGGIDNMIVPFGIVAVISIFCGIWAFRK
jgi:hypothetical protein